MTDLDSIKTTLVNISKGDSILDTLLALARVPIQVYEDPARMRPADVPLLEADITRIRAHTDWRPRLPFEDALQQTLNYWRTVIAAEF